MTNFRSWSHEVLVRFANDQRAENQRLAERIKELEETQKFLLEKIRSLMRDTNAK